MRRTYTIGVDFGTNSARAIVVDTADGRIAGSHTVDYPSGDRGVLLDPRDPHLARQDPGDCLHALRRSVAGALEAARAAAGFSSDQVIGIGVETTGSTPLPVDAANRPLALDSRWRPHLAAHAWLWKDHTAAAEAAAITRTAAAHAAHLLEPIGGTYSSEWFWSKIWRCLNVAPDVFDAAVSWVELADFIPSVLAGVGDPRAIRRSVCAAGHKALYAEAWGGLPSREFLARLDPRLADLPERLFDRVHAADTPAGTLCGEWAEAWHLRPGLPIAMGAFDAHYGAVGVGVRPGTLVKIIGTSTCDCAIAPLSVPLSPIAGICGIVPGSILPDHYGIEAGQSAVGDILNWWVDAICEGDADLHAALSAGAAALSPGESGLLALDWNNGNRTILVDPRLTGLLLGQTLHTSRAEVYRALIEATAFGARAIVDRLVSSGVPVDRVVCCGGIAEKNPVFMQIYADVLGRPMHVAGSPQAPALGAAISAAVAAAGGAETFAAVQARMVPPDARVFTPSRAAMAVYDELYGLYRELHDTFGGVAGASPALGTLMKRLLDLRDRVVSAAAARGVPA